MEDNKQEDIKTILDHIFYDDDYKMLRSTEKITNLYQHLNKKPEESSIEQKLIGLKALINAFGYMRHYMAIFVKFHIKTEKDEQIDLYRILIDQYIQYISNDETEDESQIIKEYHLIIINVLKSLISNVTCPFTVFDYLYSLFRAYLNKRITQQEDETTPTPTSPVVIKKLTERRFIHYLTILSILYGSNVRKEAPNNYIYLSGKGEILTPILDQNRNNISFNKSFSIFVWFKITINQKDMQRIFEYNNQREFKDKDIQSKKDESPRKIISIIQGNESSLVVSLTNNNCLISSSSCAMDSFEKEKKLLDNKWHSLILTCSPLSNAADIDVEIILNEQELFHDIFKVSQKEINSISFFKNFIGEVSSILYMENKNHKELIKLFNCKTFQHGIKTEKAFMHLHNEHANDNYALFKSIKGNIIHPNPSEGNQIKFLYIPSRYEQDNTTSIILKDSFLNANLSMENQLYFNGVNIHKKHFRDISMINGLYNLLPLIELMGLSNLKNNPYPLIDNILSLKAIDEFGILIMTIIGNLSKDKSSKEAVFFFQILSLFLERLPKKYFTEKLFDYLRNLTITKTIVVTKGEMSANLTNEIIVRILLNESIFFKFELNLQEKVCQTVENYYIDFKSKIPFDMIKIASILLEMDKEKYNKFCCSDHAKAFINADCNNTYNIKSIFPVITGLIRIILKQKPEDIILFSSLLTKEMSSCLQLFIIKFIIGLLNKGNDSKSKLLEYLINDNFLLNVILFALSISTFDIRIQLIILLQHYLNWNLMNCSANEIIFIQTHIVPAHIMMNKDKTEDLGNHSDNSIEKLDNSRLTPRKLTDDITSNSFTKINVAQDELTKSKSIPNKILHDNQTNLMEYLNKDHFNDCTEQLFQILFSWITDFDKNSIDVAIHCIIKVLPFCDITSNIGFIKSISAKLDEYKKYLFPNKQFYHWLIETLFQLFLKKDPKLKGDLRFSQINTDDNSRFLEEMFNTAINLYSKMSIKNIYKLDYFLQWCYYYKELYHNDACYLERLNMFIKNILETILIEVLKDCEMDDPNEKKCQIFLYYFSIVFEFSIIFQLGNNWLKEDFDKEYLINIPHYYSSLFNQALDGNNQLIQDKWLNYSLFKNASDKCFILWRDQYSGNSNKENIITKNKNLNQLVNGMSILILENYGSNDCSVNKGIPLIFMISNMMASIINEIKSMNELNSLLLNYKEFLLFVIIGSYCINQEHHLYTKIQTSSKEAICFGISFLIHQFNQQQNSLLSDKIFEAIKELFDWIIFIVQHINKEIRDYETQDTKDKAINFFKSLLISTTNGPKTNCAIYELFNEIPFRLSEELYNNVTAKDEDLKKKLYSSNLKEYLINNSMLGQIIQHIFIYKKINQERLDNITKIKPLYETYCNHSKGSTIKNDISLTKASTNTNIVIAFAISRRQYFNNKYDVYVKTNQFIKGKLLKKYHKIKHDLFIFRGLWSQKELYYENRDKVKYRVMEHMTKDYTHPIIYPILDYEYYLPNFSAFNKKDLFYDKKTLQSLIDIDTCHYFINESNTEGNSNEDLAPITSSSTNNNNIISRMHKVVFEGIKDQNDDNKKSTKEVGCFIDFLINQMIISTNNQLSMNDNKEPLQCCLVKPSYHIRGYIFCDSRGVNFYGYEWPLDPQTESYDKERHSCFGSIFKTPINHKRQYHILIPYSKIERILKRRYLYKETGIELYTIYKKSIYFIFFAQDKRDKILTYLIKHIKTEIINIDYRKFYKEVGYENLTHEFYNGINQSPISLSKKYDQWVEWKIPTIEMLMYANILANRSYSDLMQYPVFPWIITDYKTNTYGHLALRDFTKPIGMLEVCPEAKNRRDNYIAHYESSIQESNNSKNRDVPYVYGTHYSNSMYVSYYLMRLFPYSQIKVELQGSTFDNPNRLFNSIKTSFHCVSTQKADVRELIPEFFCLPEMFLNVNNLDFGSVLTEDKTTKMRIEGVIMPIWSRNDPYEFVSLHRKKLESSKVGESISSWLDIIFGVLQKEGKGVYNLFLEGTYENYEVTYKKLNKSNQEYSCRMLEFGVTPHQIFSSKANQRKSYDDITKRKTPLSPMFKISLRQLYFYNRKDSLTSITTIIPKYYVNNNKLYFIKSIDNEDKLIVYNQKIVLWFKLISRNDDTITIENKKIYYYEQFLSYCIQGNGISVPMYSFHNSKAPIITYNKGECIIKGGYMNGQIFTQHLTSKDVNVKYYIQEDISPIVVMTIDQDEKFLLCGTLSGLVHIYFIAQKESPIDLKLHKTLKGHHDTITAIHCNSRLNVFGTASLDGFIMLYTMPHCKLFNLLKIPAGSYIDHLFISSSPLPSIAYYDKKVMTWNSYSINGKKLIDAQYSEHLVDNAKFYTDINFIDHVIYSTVNKTIVILELPLLVPGKRDKDNYNSIDTKEINLFDLDVTNDRMAGIFLGMDKNLHYQIGMIKYECDS